ncbi:hypothetical protein ABZ924_10995 [Streptomyces sp. NPDC046876]|uniref:hypothetical protein n=1 Tax=Streptomyces sp. NPDC046876 TaxID=3155616 RepID=UPI0033C143F9
MTDIFTLWQRAETAKWVDVTAGFLAARHPRDSVEHAEVMARAREVHGALERGEPCAADSDAALWLRIRAAELADAPHAPGIPRPAEQDAQVRDYLKDLLARERAAGRPSWEEQDALFGAHITLSVVSRRLCANPAATASEREDVHYLVARGRMALDLGHAPAAQREADRLRRLEERILDRAPAAAGSGAG